MTERHRNTTYVGERRLVVPEYGSRFRPRSVQAPKAVDGVSRPIPQKSQHVAPTVAHTAVHDSAAASKKSAVRHKSSAKPALPRQHRSEVLARQINRKAVTYQKQAKRARIQSAKAFLMGGVMAATLLVVGLGVAGFKFTANHANSQPQTLGATDSAQSQLGSDVVTLDMVKAHTVAAEAPRVLTIARLGVSARVFGVTTNAVGQPDPVANVNDVSWLKSGGNFTAGQMVISGYSSGAFGTLRTLSKGDVVEIERGDGERFTYEVQRTAIVTSNGVDMNEVAKADESGKPGLTLMTNVGRFNVRTNQYEQRIIVWSIQK